MLDQFETVRLIWTVSLKWRAKADGTLLERPRGRRDKFLSAESLLRDKQLFPRGLTVFKRDSTHSFFTVLREKYPALLDFRERKKKAFLSVLEAQSRI